MLIDPLLAWCFYLIWFWNGYVLIFYYMTIIYALIVLLVKMLVTITLYYVWPNYLDIHFMPQSHCAESTAEWRRIDNSSLFGCSFLVILAMTMTMTINSNSVLSVHVASAGRYESFEHVQKICVPSTNNFHSWLCTLKTSSYLLCHTT